MKLLVINGPNLNFLGIREPNVYGKETYEDLCNLINNYCQEQNIEVEIFQSNHEGALVDKIQEAYFQKIDGIVINPGAYTHTSIALLDAVKSVSIPTVEIHISNLNQREDFRQVSYVGMACVKRISGLGLNGYIEAIKHLQN